MPLSTTPRAIATPARTVCPAAGWCVDHRETHPNVVLHLSELSTGADGIVSGVKAYTWGNDEPIGRGTLVIFTPLPGTSAPIADWRVQWLEAIFGAAA